MALPNRRRGQRPVWVPDATVNTTIESNSNGSFAAWPDSCLTISDETGVHTASIASSVRSQDFTKNLSKTD